MKLTVMNIIDRLPQNAISIFAGKIARSPFSKLFIPLFIKKYQVETTKLEKPLKQYESMNDFFTRKLRPHAFSVNPSADAIVSPVNGTVASFGRIDNGTLLQAKGFTYTVDGLLGNQDFSDAYKNGFYMTIYLSPSDYHRIHTPYDSQITGYQYIPGRLFPVNEKAVHTVDHLFTKNERLISHCHSAIGLFSVVKVGAFIVGCTKVSYDSIQTNLGKVPVRKQYSVPIIKKKAEELGWFEFGSTVVLLFENEELSFAEGIQHGTKIKMGESILTRHPKKKSY